jgi:hypothetical protein
MPSETTDPDGVQFVGTADVDVSSLNQHDASEYRHELWKALREPGIEFDAAGEHGDADRKFYEKKLVEVDAYLKTFPEQV